MEFISSIHEEAKSLFPRILSFSREDNRVNFEIEYVPYNNFSDVIMSGLYPASELSSLLTKIYDKLQAVLYIELPNIQDATQKINYVSLTQSRLDETIHQLPTDQYLRDFILAKNLKINGEIYPGVYSILHQAESFLKDKKIPATCNHGDLIFQDILVDPTSNSFYLIDPNGDSVGYMYDIAKTLLCLETKYDMFYHGEYLLRTESKNATIPEATIELKQNLHYETLEAMRIHFWHYLEANQNSLFSKNAEWKKTLLVLCGLQNLAIVMFHALHHKKYDRASAFLLNGVKTITDVIR